MLLSVSARKICFTIPVCHCAEAGTLTIPVRLAGQPAVPERSLSLTVVASVSASQKPAYDLLQRAICEAMALRLNLDDALISSGIPPAFVLAESGLPSETISRLTTFTVHQLAKWTVDYTRWADQRHNFSYSGEYSYPSSYAAVNQGTALFDNPDFYYVTEYESRTGLQIFSEVPDNSLIVNKVVLELQLGKGSSTTGSYPLNLNRLTGSALLTSNWSLMDPIGFSATALPYSKLEIDLTAIFDGKGELNLSIGSGDLTGIRVGHEYTSGAYTYTSLNAWQYLCWGPGTLPQLRLDYLKGYTAAEVMRFVLTRICHESDGATAHKAALAFNTRFGKTAAHWGICD